MRSAIFKLSLVFKEEYVDALLIDDAEIIATCLPRVGERHLDRPSELLKIFCDEVYLGRPLLHPVEEVVFYIVWNANSLIELCVPKEEHVFDGAKKKRIAHAVWPVFERIEARSDKPAFLAGIFWRERLQEREEIGVEVS